MRVKPQSALFNYSLNNYCCLMALWVRVALRVWLWTSTASLFLFQKQNMTQLYLWNEIDEAQTTFCWPPI